VSLRQHGQGVYGELNGVRIFRIQERVINERNKFTYLNRLAQFFIRSAAFLSREHMRNPYNLIHVHSVPDFEVFSAIIPKLCGAMVILDIHDLVPEFYASKFGASGRSVLANALKAVEKLSVWFSDHVIISNHIWEKVLTSRSVAAEKCTTILNYPDTSLFRRTEVPKDERKVVLLYPGTLSWHQGLDIAVKAFAQITDEVPEAEFRIYGDGPARRELSALIKNLKLEGRVLLKGLVSIEEMARIMAAADIGVVPKRNDRFGGEAFSTKTLEFMSAGVPIILSRTKIDSYYFEDSVVRFFEPESEKDLANAMLMMIKSPQSRLRQAEMALYYVLENNWDLKKSIYLNLVDSLLSKQKR
jgi:glycosyltransferase involved in cell wall biosynthesis